MNKKLKEPHSEAWRLFITAHARIIEQIDQDLTEAGKVTLHWYDVLIELYEAPEKRLRMHELAERVVLSRSGLTRLVDRLEKEEFLTRQLDPNDRRGFYAIITDKGVVALREAWPIYADGISRFFAQHLTEEEAASFSRIFSKMLKSLK